MNQIFYAPSLPQIEKNNLEQLKSHFDRSISGQGYFLIPSSGSSLEAHQSLKLYAIRKQNFLNSAERVNMEFILTREMNWGCVLPTYHVGGLSILARAHLAHSEVEFSSWKNFSIDWITKNNIQLLSLVPTQIFDLVQNNLKAPDLLKYVFVGGASLAPEIEKAARDLGWPLVLTFGMTETSSMIASRGPGNSFYRPFQGVEILKTADNRMKIKSNSLAEYVLQKCGEAINLDTITLDNYYTSQDHIECQGIDFRFLSRATDQIKINGENVSLFRLRQKLENLLLTRQLSPNSCVLISYPDLRAGDALMLVFTQESFKLKTEILKQFNDVVQPYERISKTYFFRGPLPMSELNKIKYQQLRETVLNDLLGETNEKV